MKVNMKISYCTYLGFASNKMQVEIIFVLSISNCVYFGLCVFMCVFPNRYGKVVLYMKISFNFPNELLFSFNYICTDRS